MVKIVAKSWRRLGDSVRKGFVFSCHGKRRCPNLGLILRNVTFHPTHRLLAAAECDTKHCFILSIPTTNPFLWSYKSQLLEIEIKQGLYFRSFCIIVADCLLVKLTPPPKNQANWVKPQLYFCKCINPSYTSHLLCKASSLLSQKSWTQLITSSWLCVWGGILGSFVVPLQSTSRPSEIGSPYALSRIYFCCKQVSCLRWSWICRHPSYAHSGSVM